jgi:hypothetical protein
MKFQIIVAGLVALLLGAGTHVLAQSQSGQTFTHGESKRCEGLSGTAKDQCDREEATKTQGPAAQDARTDSSSSASSSTSGGTQTFTHGESKRCESLTGADQDQCDKEEATKTEGDEAQKASK